MRVIKMRIVIRQIASIAYQMANVANMTASIVTRTAWFVGRVMVTAIKRALLVSSAEETIFFSTILA